MVTGRWRNESAGIWWAMWPRLTRRMTAGRPARNGMVAGRKRNSFISTTIWETDGTAGGDGRAEASAATLTATSRADDRSMVGAGKGGGPLPDYSLLKGVSSGLNSANTPLGFGYPIQKYCVTSGGREKLRAAPVFALVLAHLTSASAMRKDPST